MSAIISYKGNIVATVPAGEHVRLACKGNVMRSNIRVECTDNPVEDTNGSYDEGYATGKAEGYLEGESAGYDKCTEDMQDELQTRYSQGVDAGENGIMDAHLANGNRTDFDYAFYGIGWTDESFKPNHDMAPTKMNRTFFGSKITNLAKILRDRGVTLDLSKCPAASATFCLSTSSITHFPSIPRSIITNASLSCSVIKSAKSLKVLEGLHGLTYWVYGTDEDGYESYNGGTSLPNDLFQNLESLEEILNFVAEVPPPCDGGCVCQIYRTCGIFTGTVNLSWSPNLSRETLLRVADALASERDFSDDWNFIIGEANMAKLTDEEITAITEKGWVVS